MKKIDATIQHWRSTIFPPTTDQIWQEWLRFKKREVCDLRELLKGEYRLDLRARGLFLLLTPNFALAPFSWRSRVEPNDGSYPYLISHEDLQELSADLLRYAAEFVATFAEYVKESPTAVENATAALEAYNRCIHRLLVRPELPEETKEELFRHFLVNDPIAYYSMDDASGYNPFRRLLGDPAVDEKWKRQADAQVQAVIVAERSGKARPRQSHEDAFKCYGYLLTDQLFRGKLPYSAEFFANQVKFLLSMGGGSRFSSSDALRRAFGVLVGNEYAELRYELVRAAVLTAECLGFWTAEDVKFGGELYIEYGFWDTELGEKLGKAVAAGARRAIENVVEAARHRAAEQALLAKMR